MYAPSPDQRMRLALRQYAPSPLVALRGTDSCICPYQELSRTDPDFGLVAEEFSSAWRHPAPHGKPQVRNPIQIPAVLVQMALKSRGPGTNCSQISRSWYKLL